jgi:histidine decarboxylase
MQAPVYSDFDGRVDVDKLIKLVNFFAERHHGIIINLNYGTTFTGAYDEIHKIVPALKEIFDKNHLNEIKRELHDPDNDIHIQDIRKGYWIHVDAALGGALMPYLRRYAEKHLVTK